MESMLIIICLMILRSVAAFKCFGATPRGDQLVECFPEATHCFTAYGVYKKSGRKATMKGCFDGRPCTLENLWELFGADSDFVTGAKNDADWNQEPSCCNCAECNGPALHHPYLLMVNRRLAPPQVIACSISHSVELVGIAVSGVSLTLLNVDKFIFFRWPLKYLLLSQRRAFYLCAAVAGASVVFVALMWIFRVVVIIDDGFCTLMTPPERTVAYQAYVVLFCVIPVVSSVILSAFLYRLMHTRHIRKEAASEGITTPLSLSAKLQSLLFIFATTAWTSLSLLPYAVNWLVVQDFLIQSTDCSTQKAEYQIARTFLYLLYLNPIVNPLITLVVYAPYRTTLLGGMCNAYKTVFRHVRASQCDEDMHM